jgi:hypothetical protein
MASVPARLVDELIRDGAAALLKQHGYRKRGRHFTKDNAQSSSSIAFRASVWNGTGTARFTIDLASHFPALELPLGTSSYGQMITRLSGSICTGIGSLVGGEPSLWWAASPPADPAQCAADVGDTLANHALPWLESVSTLHGLAAHGRYLPLSRFLPSPEPCLAAASALAAIGRQAEAIALFAEYQAMPGHSRDIEQGWLPKYGA